MVRSDGWLGCYVRLKDGTGFVYCMLLGDWDRCWKDRLGHGLPIFCCGCCRHWVLANFMHVLRP